MMMNRHRRHRLLQLALIGIALRAMAPAGYMPASLAGGLPFVPCPGGFAGAAWLPGTRGDAHVEHGHAPDDAPAGVTWKFCPFGVLFAFLGPVEHAALPSLPAADSPPFAPDRIARTFLVRSWSARAPPNRH
jgi:hypothetical protein